MSYIEAIILGIIQGATEFLPVSSSGHLIVIPKLLNFESGGQSFDAIIHLATGFSLLAFFGSTWKNLILKAQNHKEERQELVKIVVATIPAGLIGFLFGNIIENYFRSEFLVAGALILVSLLMLITEKIYIKQKKEETNILPITALIIGVSQIIAFIPGVSRSGITILTGMLLGIRRDISAKFSFILATPIVFVAGIYSFVKTIPNLDFALTVQLVLGFISAFFMGLFCIEFLLNYLKKSSLVPFAVYRVILGILVIITFLYF